MRWIFVLFAFLLFGGTVIGQDVIVTRSGQTINAEVVAITKKEVKFKLSGSNYDQVRSIPVKDVEEVRKEDGTVIKMGEKDKSGSNNDLLGESPSFMSFQIGPSLPLGSFAYADGESNAGYANTGFSWQFETAYFIKPAFGLGFKYTSFANPTNEQAWEQAFRNANPGVELNLNTGTWFTGVFAGGLYYSLVYDRVIVDFNIMLGLMSVLEPEFELQYATAAGTVISQIQPSSGGSFAASTGAGIRLALSDQWGMKLGTELFFGKPRIETSLLTTVNGSTFIDITTYEQSISSANLMAGVIYQF